MKSAVAFMLFLAAASVLLASCVTTLMTQSEFWPAVKGIEGTVVAHLNVEPNGRVSSVKIVRSPNELLSQAVEKKAINYRFKPEPKPFIGELEVIFRK